MVTWIPDCPMSAKSANSAFYDREDVLTNWTGHTGRACERASSMRAVGGLVRGGCMPPMGMLLE